MCIAIIIFLKDLKLSLEKEISNEEIYKKETKFTDFTDRFVRIEQPVSDFNSLLSLEFCCYLAIILHRFVCTLYALILFDECGVFSVDFYKYIITFTVVNFFIFILPMASLNAEVRQYFYFIFN